MYTSLEPIKSYFFYIRLLGGCIIIMLCFPLFLLKLSIIQWTFYRFAVFCSEKALNTKNLDLLRPKSDISSPQEDDDPPHTEHGVAGGPSVGRWDKRKSIPPHFEVMTYTILQKFYDLFSGERAFRWRDLGIKLFYLPFFGTMFLRICRSSKKNQAVGGLQGTSPSGWWPPGSQGANEDYGDGRWLTEEPQPTCHLGCTSATVWFGGWLYYAWFKGFFSMYWLGLRHGLGRNLRNHYIYQNILHICFEGLPKLGDLVW